MYLGSSTALSTNWRPSGAREFGSSSQPFCRVLLQVSSTPFAVVETATAHPPSPHAANSSLSKPLAGQRWDCASLPSLPRFSGPGLLAAATEEATTFKRNDAMNVYPTYEFPMNTNTVALIL